MYKYIIYILKNRNIIVLLGQLVGVTKMFVGHYLKKCIVIKRATKQR